MTNNKPDLLTRIATRQRNAVTSAQILMAEVSGIMDKVRQWHGQIDNMTGRQLVAMLFILQKMKSDLAELRAGETTEDQLETIKTQADVLREITMDVTTRLKALGTDIDIVLAETKPEEMARIIVEQSRNDATLLYTEETRHLQRANDFAGLVSYLNDHEPDHIVAALLQLPNDKAVAIVRMIKESETK